MSKLCIPEEILQQHFVALGKTGSGKSSVLRYLVEHLLSEKKRVFIIDPKGDWWGLKSGADGRSAGFPVILFGDFKEAKASDIPINSRSGAHIAELITSGNRPCVIGFRGWKPSDMRQFWIDFASTLFNQNTGELYGIIDEVHNFAPKGKILDPKAGEMLHWSNRLLSEGRGLGLVFGIASQRPQKVHNDTLTCCETLIAMKVNHASDRQAVKEWIDGCGDKEQGKIVLDNLASLAKGEAFVWCPEIGFGPERKKFPLFKTFNSFAPPQLQEKIHTKDWASVDLDKVKEKLAVVIEEAKANDPKELKLTLREKDKEINALKDHIHELNNNGLDKDVVPRIQLKEFEETITHLRSGLAMAEQDYTRLQKLLSGLITPIRPIIEGALSKLDQALELANPNFYTTDRWQKDKENHEKKPIDLRATLWPDIPIHDSSDKKYVIPAGEKIILPKQSQMNGKLPPGERKILTAIAQYPEGISRASISVLTDYKKESIRIYCNKLFDKGYFVMASNGALIATKEGIAALGDFKPLPKGKELREYYMRTLPPGEAKILDQLIIGYPHPRLRDWLIEATEYKRESIRIYLNKLSARHLVRIEGSQVFASDTLFTN
jgi:hypothetical protein